MKGLIALAALLAAGMVFFGCTTSTEYSANHSTGGTENASGAESSGGAQGSAEGSAPGATQPSGASTGGTGTPTAGGVEGAETPAETQPGTSSAQDFIGKDYSDLMGLGTASQCTVTSSDESGKPLTLNLYFDGNNNMRMEQHDTGYPDCPYALMVYKGGASGNGMLYMTCPGHEEEALGQDFMTDENCEWQSMDIEEQWGGIGSASRGLASGYSTPMLEYLQSPDYSCQGWTSDGSKFDVSGFVCD